MDYYLLHKKSNGAFIVVMVWQETMPDDAQLQACMVGYCRANKLSGDVEFIVAETYRQIVMELD